MQAFIFLSFASVVRAATWAAHAKRTFLSQRHESGSNGSRPVAFTSLSVHRVHRYVAAEVSAAGDVAAQTGPKPADWVGFASAEEVLEAALPLASDTAFASSAMDQLASGSQRALLSGDDVPKPGGGSTYASSTSRVARSTANLTCADPGCTASTTVVVPPYNESSERLDQCYLTVKFWPTDFDDIYSREVVDYIAVAGSTLKTDCFPNANLCATGRAMFKCIEAYPVDALIGSSTALNVTSKISKMVDECSFDGNLLSAEVLLGCRIVQLPQTTTLTPALPQPIDHPTPPLYSRTALRCTYHGCKAEASLHVGQYWEGLAVDTCLLNLVIMQTDYDNEEGNFEGLEYVTVDGTNITESFSPGLNPCLAEIRGKPLDPGNLSYTLLANYTISNATARYEANESLMIPIAAKITKFVDECGYNGYLLNGYAEMTCSRTWRRPKT